MATTYTGCDWFAADTFIRGGRNENCRRFSKTRELRRLHNGDIALKLHHTDIVTYHTDGSQTIHFGGWDTVTTKKDVNRYSSANVYGMSKKLQRIADGDTLAVYHASDPLAAPKIVRCGSCRGKGEVTDRCPGFEMVYSYWHHSPDAVWRALPGMIRSESTVRERYTWEPESVGETVTVVHDTTPRRPSTHRPCGHGFLERHLDHHECLRCNGTGQLDYGSYGVPFWFDATDRVTVDATGRVIFDEQVGADVRRAYIALRKRMRRQRAA
jgi:hypothetical protein